MKYSLLPTLLLCLNLASAASAATVAVPGTAGPWDPLLNPSFNYGVGDQTAPAVVDGATGLQFFPGAALIVTYLSGLVADGSCIPSAPPTCVNAPLFDANGGPSTFITNSYNAVNGPFPSYFMDPSVPVYSTQLVGTFAFNGVIVGTPFAIGNGPKTLVVPKGANQLLLGTNDNLYVGIGGALSPNPGAFIVDVTNTPEPGTLLLLGVALAGLAVSTARPRWLVQVACGKGLKKLLTDVRGPASQCASEPRPQGSGCCHQLI